MTSKYYLIFMRSWLKRWHWLHIILSSEGVLHYADDEHCRCRWLTMIIDGEYFRYSEAGTRTHAPSASTAPRQVALCPGKVPRGMPYKAIHYHLCREKLR